MTVTGRTRGGLGLAAFVTIVATAGGGSSSEEVERGAELFRVCATCHQIGEGAKNAVGPQLNGLFGRRAGSVEGARYSEDLIRAGQNGLKWNAEALDAYLENPRNLISKTRMQFRGIADPAERRDLIAYLRKFSDNPRDIPEAAPTAQPHSLDPVVDPEILAIQGDPAYGEYLAGECLTCHQASGEDEGIPSIVGWPEEIFVTAMHAYRSKARTHPVMRMMAAKLTDEEIASLAAYFGGLN